MAIAISLQFGNWLPVRKLGPDNHEYIYQPKSHQDALHNGITLADITCTATDLWQHVQALTPTELVPKIEKGKVKSLNMQLKKEPSWERDFMGTISMRKTVSLTVPHYRDPPLTNEILGGGGGTIEISVKYFIWNMKFPPPPYIHFASRRGCWGGCRRGEILGFFQDRLLQKHYPRMLSLISLNMS